MVDWEKIIPDANAVANTYTTTEVTAEAAKVRTVTGEPVVAPPVPGLVVEVTPSPPKNSWLKSNILYLAGMVALAVYILYLLYGMFTKMEPVTVTYDPLSFSQVLEVKPYYLRAQRRDGQIQINSQGSAAWRYNNPAKIAQGSFAREHGSLGSDGTLALFPSYDVGRKAAEDLLFNDPALGFSNSTIENAIAHWALKSEKYNPSTYTNNVVDAAGVSKSTEMFKLTPEQRKKFLDQVQKEEGYKEGKTTVFKDDADFKAHGF